MNVRTPLLLLHASSASRAQWSALAARLAPRNEVLALDLIGCGRAPARTGRGRFCLADEAAPIRGVLGRLGQPAHLVGHSYGGAVALHLARVRPEYVRTLTVIEPVAFHLLRDGDAEDRAALREISGVANGVARALAGGDLHGGLGGFALHFEAVLDEPAGLEDMADIRAPTLILQGGRTPLPTRCVSRLLARAIPHALLRVVSGAGHMLPLTHGDEVARHIAAHIAQAGDGPDLYAFHRARAHRLRARVLRAWTKRLARCIVSVIAGPGSAPREQAGRRRCGARQGS